jgi:hypothetical protein
MPSARADARSTPAAGGRRQSVCPLGSRSRPGLGPDGLRQQRSRAVAQNLGQPISKSSWLGELENVSVGHVVSLLRWRSGGAEHSYRMPP